MARVTNEIADFHGKIGNIVFSNMYDTKYAKIYSERKNPRTPKQVAHRNLFGQVMNICNTWLYGLTKNYFIETNTEHQAYRASLKYNWAHWSKQREAFWEAIPIFQYGNFCINVEVIDAQNTQIVCTLEKTETDLAFENIPQITLAKVILIEDFRKQVIRNIDNVDFSEDAAGYKIKIELDKNDYSKADYDNDTKSILLNFFYDTVDQDTGKIKKTPFQNSINRYSDLSLSLPYNKAIIKHKINLLKQGNGRFFANVESASYNEEVELYYWADYPERLLSVSELGGKITERQLRTGRFKMPFDEVFIKAIFNEGEHEMTLDETYPIGSIWIGLNDAHPTVGVWRKLATGKTLWNDDMPDGREIEASLPNIRGKFGATGRADGLWDKTAVGTDTGAFKDEGTYEANGYSSTTGTNSRRLWTFSASRSSEIYKDDCITVQPPAFAVSMWIREA